MVIILHIGVYTLQALECRGRGCESVLELGFILCVTCSYVGRGLKRAYFPSNGSYQLSTQRIQKFRKRKAVAALAASAMQKEEHTSWSSITQYAAAVCNCVPKHSRSNTGLPLLDEIINVHGVFSYSDFDGTPCWIRLATEPSVRTTLWAITTNNN
jgi:hypothetical protein